MKTFFKNLLLGNLSWLIVTAATVSNLFYDRGVLHYENDTWEWVIAIISTIMLSFVSLAPKSAEALYKRIFGY